MSAITPGDFVRCIETDTYQTFHVEVGKVYRCSEVTDHDGTRVECTVHGARCRQGGLRLSDKALPPFWWWCAACFTPIYRPKIEWSEFAKIKLPLDPEKVRDLRVKTPQRQDAPS